MDQIERMVFDMWATVIVYGSGESHWPIPDWMKDEIPLDRMATTLAGRGEEATELEALAYLHTASLTMPFDDRWTRVMMFVFEKVMRKKGHDESHQLITGVELLQDERRLLMDLRRWIFREQVKLWKAKREGKRLLVEPRQADLQTFGGE